jgi:hypothetical protein
MTFVKGTLRSIERVCGNKIDVQVGHGRSHRNDVCCHRHHHGDDGKSGKLEDHRFGTVPFCVVFVVEVQESFALCRLYFLSFFYI